MAKSTSVKLGDYFDEFIAEQVKHGRYGSASEVIRQGLRMLEEHERKLESLRQAIIEGEESGDGGILDMQDIVREAKQEAGVLPPDA